MEPQTPPDGLNEIGVLKRRTIEARILAAFLDELSDSFERAEVIQILRRTVTRVAQAHGAALADQYDHPGLENFSTTLPDWTKDGALEMEVLEQSSTAFHFNVTRCRYAEMYAALGIPELGEVLSCNRDFKLIEGFNPEIKLSRTQTIMSGAPFCDFRYHLSSDEPVPDGQDNRP
jgi:hypothetical protein